METELRFLFGVRFQLILVFFFSSIFVRKQAQRDRMGDEGEETSLMEDIEEEEEEDMMNQIKPRPVFQSFPQAVGKINIKTVAQIDPRFAASEDPHDDESDSVFHNMLVHWSELDLSEGFGSILRRVRSLSRTLAMTVYNGDRIFACLKEHALDKERPLELYLESLYQVRPLTQFFPVS